MSQSFANSTVTAPDNSLVNVRPHMAKAGLHDNQVLVSLSSVVKDIAKRVHGKQGVAAAIVGKDEGNYARDITAGRMTLRELAAHGPEYLAALGKELHETYGQMASPLDRLRQIHKLRRELDDEALQIAEGLAS